MIDEYHTNSQIFLLAIYTVIPSVLAGVFLYKLKKTNTDRRFIIAGLAGIAVSSLMFFGSSVVLISDVCCEIDMDNLSKTFFQTLRFLSTPFAFVSTCFFYRGLSEKFNRKYIAETSILMVLVWMMLFFI
ncbi:hypothetical protein [Nitrosopumilus piranensis]|uniref:Uncharacterized protein n=1 Tax=Nitrosopumilus piranensis TaxID=1582439 RepID=A0A0C5BXS2_9ARCH|nr:hypothetical protein [Nitrosopumilus piranensis]AJM93106.1 membrane protein of unknown function [Nitrosopumilus piranensis]